MRRTSRAFTLIEVLVCCTMLASVIGLSAGLLLTASKYLKQSKTRLLRTYVAEQVMEDILEAGFHYVEDLPTTGVFKMEAKLRGRPQSLGFTYRISIVRVSPSLKSVLLTIGDGSGKETSYETTLTEFL